MRKYFLFILCLFLGTAAYTAPNYSEVRISASANKTVLSMNEELVVSVTVEGATGDFAPEIPSLPAFNVYGSSVVQQSINFHTSTTFEYIMMPRFPGQSVINPFILYYGNKVYKTEPITVTVYRSDNSAKSQPAVRTNAAAKNAPVRSAPAPENMSGLDKNLYNQAIRKANSPYFMVASVSDSNPYINQTVTLAVRFYYSRAFAGSAPYTAPSITNLFMEPIGDSEGNQVLGKTAYSYLEKRYTLSGVTAGKAEVGPASVTYTPRPLDFSVLDRMFSIMSHNPETAESNSVALTIRPLPANKPASFYGAVGKGYTISAALDREQVEAGEAVNLTVKVNGPGNLKPTSDLKIASLPGLKIYDVASSAGTVNVDGKLKSYKIFKTVIVPVSSGTYTLPALPWSYFDPAAKEYKTIYTQPLTMQVSPSSKTASGFDFRTHHTELDSGILRLGQDIHYLKSTLASAEPIFPAKLARFGIINYIVFAGLLFAFIFTLADKKSLAEKRTLSKIPSQLKAAQREEDIASALSVYVQLKYGVHTGSLPLRDITASLEKHGCAAPLALRFETLWKKLEAARFAPVNLQGSSVYDLAGEAASLIKDMDKKS